MRKCYWLLVNNFLEKLFTLVLFFVVCYLLATSTLNITKGQRSMGFVQRSIKNIRRDVVMDSEVSGILPAATEKAANVSVFTYVKQRKAFGIG